MDSSTAQRNGNGGCLSFTVADGLIGFQDDKPPPVERKVSFDDLVCLVQAPGFREVGGRGSHRVFAHPDVAELVNLQVERGQAKRYQLRQVVGLVRR